MKKTAQPQIRNVHDLRLAKQTIKYDIRLKEEILKSGFIRFRQSFTDSLKRSARIMGQELAITVLLRIIRSQMKK